MVKSLPLTDICQGERYRPVDTDKANDIAKSMQAQGLLQPIGVKPCDCAAMEGLHWRLLFGAHRLHAAQQLQWETMDATVFGIDLSPEMARLAELQENSARHDLTGAQRKQYAAEVGRLISKMGENSDVSNGNEHWLPGMGKKIGVPQTTMYNWWKAFCQESGLSLTPRQALDLHKEQFFAWLEEQNRKAEEEKARKSAEERRLRQERDCVETVEHLCELAAEYGVDVVEDKVINAYYLRIEALIVSADDANDSPEDERPLHATHE
jgi:hypothetical protein